MGTTWKGWGGKLEMWEWRCWWWDWVEWVKCGMDIGTKSFTVSFSAILLQVSIQSPNRLRYEKSPSAASVMRPATDLRMWDHVRYRNVDRPWHWPRYFLSVLLSAIWQCPSYLLYRWTMMQGKCPKEPENCLFSSEYVAPKFVGRVRWNSEHFQIRPWMRRSSLFDVGGDYTRSDFL